MGRSRFQEVDLESLRKDLQQFHKSLRDWSKVENQWRNLQSVWRGPDYNQFSPQIEQLSSTYNDVEQTCEELASFLENLIEILIGLKLYSLATALVNTEKRDSLKYVRLVEGKSALLGKNLDFPKAIVPGTFNKMYPGLRNHYQAHHLIPSGVADSSDLMLNAIQYANFDIDAAINGIFLPKNEHVAISLYEKVKVSLPIHFGSHPEYSIRIKEELEKEWNILKANGSTKDRVELASAVERIIKKAKNDLVPLIAKMDKVSDFYLNLSPLIAPLPPSQQ